MFQEHSNVPKTWSEKSERNRTGGPNGIRTRVSSSPGRRRSSLRCVGAPRAVVAHVAVGADQAGSKVGVDTTACAPDGIAHASATRQLEHDAVSGRYRVHRLGGQHGAGAEPRGAVTSRPPAGTSGRGIAQPVERARAHGEGRRVAVADLDALSEPPAELAGAA